MSSPFALRVKTKSGHQLIKNLTPEHTIRDLKVQLSLVSEIPQERLHVLSGFPPKVIDLSEDALLLTNSGLSHGDTLILEEKVAPQSPQLYHHVSENNLEYHGTLIKEEVPADNSCLFSSIHFALNGKLDETGNKIAFMRQVIAEAVAADPDEFSEAILGKPNLEYCAWIQDDKSWGGAIELSILSKHYGFEIAVVDTINTIINRFGEDKHYTLRILLLFDGIHYDPLYFKFFDGNDIQTIFPTDDDKILKEAENLAKEANLSRQYTDVNKFTLKCVICDVKLSGQLQAREHAQQTGHTNFGEV